MMIIAVLFIASLPALTQTIYPTSPAPGQLAPDVHAQALLQAPGEMTIGEIELSQFRGKVVYVKFWSTSCYPCIQAFPLHTKLKEKYGDQLVILGVTPHTPDEITEFLEKKKPSMIVVSDPEQTTWWRYYPRGQGSGTLIAADGRVSRVSVDDINLDEEMIDMALNNKYEPGPPLDWFGNILPHAKPFGAAWADRNGYGRSPSGQDPYSLGPEATFQIICRPAHATGKFIGGSSGKTKSTHMANRARGIIASTTRLPGDTDYFSRTPPHRVLGPDWLEERYFDFIALTPGIDDEMRASMITAAIQAGMGIKLEITRRTLPGFTLTRQLNQTLEAPEMPQSQAPHTSWIGERHEDGSSFTKASKHSFAKLAQQLERVYQMPVVSGIEDIHEYDFDIPNRNDVFTLEELSGYLTKHYGLALIPSDLEIDVIVVHENKNSADVEY